MAKAKPKLLETDPPPAEYTVVARRYRPQQFADLIGQEHVANALTNALNSGRVAHAYLFTGARGVGKTSSARILAKALNCVKGPTPTPCDECDICKSVAVGEDVDVLEIDGASNNKVEEIRDLRSNVGFRPTRARYKIYIIDEVHMLSTSAFNALLKTLEEPPPHVKFIFATTEVQKIPITILSRCQRFDFAHVSTAKIFAALQHVVAKEGLKADDEALHIIAKRAAGSMRDSQSLLDQMMAFSDGHLTAEKVHSLFGTASDDRISQLADAILKGDVKTGLEEIHTAASRGMQLGELIDQLVDYWRGMMLLLTAGPKFGEISATPALLEKMKAHAATRNLDTILAGIDILAATKQKIRGSTHVQVLLELAVVRLSRLDELLSVGQLAAAVLNNGPAPAVKAGPVTVSPQVVDPSKKKSIAALEVPLNSAPTVSSNGSVNLADLWARVMEMMGPIRGNHLRQAALPAIFGPNSLAIQVAPGYTAAYDSISNDSTTEAIRLALKKLTGEEWVIRVERGREAPTRAETPARNEAGHLRPKDVMELPLFKAAAETLGAQMVKMDPGFNPQATVAAVTEAAPVVETPPDDEE
ncbi:DNA polymerase III subunit gamma/tau [Limnoglobus roseus]|uniref:DNA polymerase III subunit gamma/tau n=1 Tax=Limnoglobus roseus TaxID=2598579 RepID=A0A5C1AAL4_9BACT|nr:DNA polymerase III subunit gamma/tau [Limnoglobus roseus]QEL15213.1 DNA polymerase III subunit gamma/tau [Limnoglobus roseus]